MKKAFFVISIDTECDKGAKWVVKQPLSFQNITIGLDRFYEPFVRSQQLKTTFLLSPEIFFEETNLKALADISHSDFGTHLHHEFYSYPDRSRITNTKGIQLALSRDLEKEYLEKLTRDYYAAFGKPPVSFRAGRFGFSSHTIPILDELGYRIDSSIIPHRSLRFESGETLDTWNAQLIPYMVNFYDPFRSGRSNILEVPVTHFAPDFFKIPKALRKPLASRNRISDKLLRTAGLSRKSFFFRPLRLSNELLSKGIEELDKAFGSQDVLINLMFHSNELFPGTSPYCETEGDVESLISDLENLTSELKKRFELIPTSLNDLINHYG